MTMPVIDPPMREAEDVYGSTHVTVRFQRTPTVTTTTDDVAGDAAAHEAFQETYRRVVAKAVDRLGRATAARQLLVQSPTLRERVAEFQQLIDGSNVAVVDREGFLRQFPID